MEVLQTAPEASTFVTLAEFQSQTPSSFHDGPPVLHYHSQRCKVVILESDLIATPALNALHGSQASTNGTTEARSSEDSEGKEVTIDGFETWVTSDKFLLYSSTASAGLSIPYPSISLHAIQRLRVPGSDTEVQGLYMQIATPDVPDLSAEDDDEESCITFTLVPPTEPGAVGGSTASAAAATSTAAERATQDLSDEPEATPTQMLYNAVSACSNLHPDPVQPGDEDDEEGKFMFSEQYGTVLGEAGGDMPPPMPGSSGWITAENVHEFFDEEGNPLGPGAGTVRGREEENGDAVDGESDETKWRRTD